MENLLEKFPYAYFITYTCYGTWLHGNKEIAVDRLHNGYNGIFLTKNIVRQNSEEKIMQEPAYYLDSYRRGILLRSIIDVSKHNHWDLFAVHIRSTHVHVVVRALQKPEKIMQTFKSYATRALNKLKIDNNRTKRWTRHGSTLYIWELNDIPDVMDYVINRQGRKMAAYENQKPYYALVDSVYAVPSG